MQSQTLLNDLRGKIQFNRYSRGQKDMEDSDIESMCKQTAENVFKDI